MFKALGAAALSIVAAPAVAQAPLAAQDVSRAQGEAMMRDMFAQVDANKDGVADAAEQTAVLDGVKAAGATEAAITSIRRIFAEGAGPDGKVTLASFVKARMASFDKLDTNHDGKLDAAEQAAGRAAAEKK